MRLLLTCTLLVVPGFHFRIATRDNARYILHDPEVVQRDQFYVCKCIHSRRAKLACVPLR